MIPKKIVTVILIAAELLTICGCGISSKTENAVSVPEATASLAITPDLTDSVEVSPEPVPEYSSGETSLTAPEGPLVINEVRLFDGDEVEIKNISDRPVLLSDYYLSDKNSDRLKIRLPDTVLEPGAIYIFEGLSLSVEGERIWLSDENEHVIDYANAQNVPAGGSYGRAAGTLEWLYFKSPSIGSENGSGYAKVSLSPVSSVQSGIYNGVDSLVVEFSCESGDIRYTLDGSLPDESSPRYTEPFLIDKSTVIRAAVFEPDAITSTVKTFSYIVNEYFTMPVVSLTFDEAGTYEKFFISPQKNTEYSGSASLYIGNEEIFSKNCGVKLKGYTAVQDQMKKNFGIYFKGEYGSTDLKGYDLFSNGVTAYSSLVLRAGQDCHAAFMRNEIMEDLGRQSTDCVPYQSNVYTILYVNGQYKGVYCLTQNMNEDFFGKYLDVSKNSITEFMPGYDDISEFDDLNTFYNLMHSSELSYDEKYEEFTKLFDVDNFIDYIILESFSGNTDLKNNVKLVKSSENGGIWYFVSYDYDCAFYRVDGSFFNVFGGYAKVSTFLIRILDSIKYCDAFREKFFSRYNELIKTTLSNDNLTSLIDAHYNQLSPEMERDLNRFGISYSSWEAHVAELRSLFTDYDYASIATSHMMTCMNMTEEEMLRYFG